MDGVSRMHFVFWIIDNSFKGNLSPSTVVDKGYKHCKFYLFSCGTDFIENRMKLIFQIVLHKCLTAENEYESENQ